jgi:hypothetical protein
MTCEPVGTSSSASCRRAAGGLVELSRYGRLRTGAAAGGPAWVGVALALGLFVGRPAAVSVASERPAPALWTVPDQDVLEILAQPTLRRAVPRIRFIGDQRTYEFLIAHPPLATQLARRVHPPLERYTVTRISEGRYTVEDLGALRGEARLVAAGAGQRIYWFKGEFRSLANLLRFTGRMVLVLTYREVQDGGRRYVESDPDFYLRIDNLFFGLMARLLSPLIHGLIDRRVQMIAEASSRLFEQVSSDPRRFYREMTTWPEVRPEDLDAYRSVLIENRGVERR